MSDNRYDIVGAAAPASGNGSATRKIILITGAPGSGKSTVARLLAKHYHPRSMHIQVDHLREMMVNGLELPGKDWEDETTRQFQWARATAINMAHLYSSQGVDVLIDDVSVPEEFPDHYAILSQLPNAHRVLLLPDRTSLIERLKNRRGPYDEILVNQVAWFYSYLETMPKHGWLVLDSSEWSVEQTAKEVLRGVGD